MPTSTRILRSIERALTSPHWGYCTIRHYPMFVRQVPRRPAAGPPSSERFDA